MDTQGDADASSPAPSRAGERAGVLLVALCCLEIAQSCKTAFKQLHVPLKIGINSGPLVAGVIGSSRLFYRVFGDGINSKWAVQVRTRSSLWKPPTT